MKKKFLLIAIVLMLGLSACSVPRLVKNDPTATPKPVQPTAQPTSQPEPTAAAPTVAPTVIPTDAPTQAPTAASNALPAELASDVSIGENLLNETFDKQGLWDTSGEAEFSAELVNGAYRMSLNKANWMLWSPSNLLNSDNVILDVDTELVNGSAENNVGLICRFVDDDNFYMLSIGNDGYVEIMRVYQGKQTDLFGEYVDDIIDPVSNHLQGFCLGDRLVFYVNGKLAADVRDSNLASGDAGLIIGSYDDPQVSVDFDNFTVYEALGNFTTDYTPEPVAGGPFAIDPVDNWEVSYSDDFDTPNNGNWTIFNESAVVSQWRDGRFAFDFNETLVTATSPTNDLTLSDVIVEMEVYRVGDVLENDMGLICRYQDPDNFYSLSFGSDGYVTIYKKVDGTWSDLFSEFVETDLSAEYHKVAIGCIGAELSLYVDDQLLATVNDTDFMTGDVGLISGTYEELPVVIEFDNFLVYTPK